MKLGAVFPHQQMPDDPAFLRDLAQMLESLGYSHILAYDHVLGAVHENREPRLIGPYTEKHAFHEPMVLFGFLAACTERLGLATGVLILPQRQTALVAKQAIEIDILSGGRFRLGIGTGWNYVEYDSLGEDFASRGARIDEQVDLLRKLTSEPVIDFSGDFHRIDRAGLLPLPDRRIPIWFGGFRPVALNRAARIGDGFILGAGVPTNLEAVAHIRSQLQLCGREASEFGFEAHVMYAMPRESWRSEIEAYKDAGVDMVCLRIEDMNPDPSSPLAPDEIMKRFRDYRESLSDLIE